MGPWLDLRNRRRRPTAPRDRLPDAGVVGGGDDQGAPNAANACSDHEAASSSNRVRIVSLLPSATETLFALGLGDQLVAVTHECDFPPEAASLPIVTRSTLALEDTDSAGIEASVSVAAAEGRSLYYIDTEAIRELRPDLVVAQDICRVCAVSADEVAGDLEGIRMIRQHPHSLADVLDDIEELATACDADASPLMAGLRDRLEAASRDAGRKGLVRGVFLEWIDPPYRAGHWTPDLLALAGIEDPLARAGVPSVALSWADVAAARPEVLILAPCGFDRDRALQEAALVQNDINRVGAARVVVLDGSAYFNRPGPRLVDSLEQLVANR
jgi:iron complex transport system substrate-binding protein